MKDQPQPAESGSATSENSPAAAPEPSHGKRIEFDTSGEPFWTPSRQDGVGCSEEGVLYRAGQRIRSEIRTVTVAGTVDEVMPDGTLLWVWLDGGAGRRLLAAAECLPEDSHISGPQGPGLIEQR